MHPELNVGDLVENGDLLGRISKIETINGKRFGWVDGHKYPLTNLAWVPDPESIRNQAALKKAVQLANLRAQQ